MMQRLVILCFAIFVAMSLAAQTWAQDATYSGVGVCANCHTAGPGGMEVPMWQQTAHATAFDSASAFVQTTAACLECHTTGWDTTSANQGADDFVTIDTTGSITVVDQTEFDKKVNVQCESCHGPASLHVAGAFSDPPVLPPNVDRAKAETCGECHQDEHHPYFEEWSLAKHAVSDTNSSGFLQGKFRNDPNCSGCHTFQGFLQFVGTTPADSSNLEPDIAEPPGDASLPIVCAACHDPHDAKNEHQLRLPPEELCIKCHNPEDAAPPDNPHHSTASMFAGTGAAPIPGVTYMTQSAHQVVEPAASEKCVTCHVFMTPFVSETEPAATGHTFQPRIEACMQAGCHVNGLVDTNGEEFNHRGRQDFTRNLIDSLQTIISDIEANVLPTASPEDSADYQIGLFNLRFVQNEGSNGVHNANYAQSILENTIAFLDTALVTSVKEFSDAGTPESFVLHQNYPNPFNPTTKIRFSVAKTTHAKLVVYNAIGQEVKTLVDEDLAPNSYEVEFDANGLSSGLYFYKLVTDGFVSVKKMLLMK